MTPEDVPGDHPVNNEISITYHMDSGRIPIVPVNGAYGGVDPMGETIMANFYVEQVTLPVAGRVPVREDGVVNTADEIIDQRSSVQRTFVASFAMSEGAARRIANWLLEKANFLEEIRKQRGEL